MKIGTMDKLGPRRKTFTSQDGTLHREQFLQTYEIVYETKMCEDFPLTFFNLKLIKQQKSKLEPNYPPDSIQTLHPSVWDRCTTKGVCNGVSVCLIKTEISMFKRYRES